MRHCQRREVDAEAVRRIHPHAFVALPQRWIVERTWSWLMNSHQLQIDYERDPDGTKGFNWAVQTRLLRRRLPAHTQQ